MSNKYLLTCECGHSVAVGTTEAGQEVVCMCGRRLIVPSLRAIRQLPVASDKPGAKRTTTGAAWNPSKGAMFAVGAILVLGGLVTAAHSYFIYTQAVVFKPSEEQFDAALQYIDKLSPTELYDTWNTVKVQGLEQAGSSPFAMASAMARESLNTCYVGLVVAAVGLFFAVTPMFIPGK